MKNCWRDFNRTIVARIEIFTVYFRYDFSLQQSSVLAQIEEKRLHHSEHIIIEKSSASSSRYSSHELCIAWKIILVFFLSFFIWVESCKQIRQFEYKLPLSWLSLEIKKRGDKNSGQVFIHCSILSCWRKWEKKNVSFTSIGKKNKRQKIDNQF